MKKIIASFVVLPILAVAFAPISQAAGQKIVVQKTDKEETSLSCDVLFTFVKWGLRHPRIYVETADLNKDKVVNPVDFTIYVRNKNNEDWCKNQLATAAESKTLHVASVEETSLASEVLFTYLKWGLRYPNQYLAIADFNHDQIVNPADFSIFVRNKHNYIWCAKQLGW